MEKIPILPEYPSNFISYYQGSNHLFILFQRYFVKKIYQENCCIQPLLRLKGQTLSGFLLPSYIFQDEYEIYYFLISDYLKNQQNLYQALSTMDEIEKLTMYKKMLLDLQNAHHHSLIPFDIAYRNYLYTPEEKATFIDFDICFYEGQSTDFSTTKTIFDLSYFHKNSSLLTEENLILNDKMLLLTMLLEGLTNQFYSSLGNNFSCLYEKLNSPSLTSTFSYLSHIIEKHHAPDDDDYFLADVIDPFLQYYTKQKEKKLG